MKTVIDFLAKVGAKISHKIDNLIATIAYLFHGR